MDRGTRYLILALSCLLGVAGVRVWHWLGRASADRLPAATRHSTDGPLPVRPDLPTFPDPNTPGRPVYVDDENLDSRVFETAASYTSEVPDESSLPDWSRAILSRVPLGLDDLRSRLSVTSRDDHASSLFLHRSLGRLFLYDGQLDEAARAFDQARRLASDDIDSRDELTALRGLTALRRGELDNCIACMGPSSCLLPIAAEARHARPEGAREAILHFNDYLRHRPGDLRVR